MPSRWSAEQVLALAPDGASVAAARGLASPGRWCGAGTDADACCAADPDADPAGRAGGPSAVWGACQGAGPGPYRTVVDLGGPAYRCTCPSRKVPCKHAVGLLLLWAAGHVRPGPPPDWAEEWLASRAARAAAGTARVAGADAGPGDPEAARRRAERRAARVTAGLEELDLWLTDQVRAGLAGVQRAGYTYVEQVAARMVDAQAPGVAGALRRLPGVLATGEAWPGRLLEELGALHMTVAGHRRLADLPADLAATVRARVGYPVSREDVLATAPVRDAWEVLGMRETAEERLTTRRTWLRGRRTGRPALVLSFAAGGQALDARLVPGTAVEAGLHFYPGAGALRALVAEERGEPEPLRGIAGESVEAAHARLGHAVAADPWVSEWPVVLAGVVPTPGPGESEGPGWTLRDRAGDVVALQPWSAQLWRLLAVSGGRPVTVAGVLAPWGLRPLAAHDGGAAERLVLL